MDYREYKFADRSEWSKGVWDSEPDKVQFTDEATGLPCLAVRNRGHWCGYVGVSEGHPFFNVSYSQCRLGDKCPDRKADEEYHFCENRPDSMLSVHGGITFDGFCQEGKEESGICHIPGAGEPERVYWFGFDCAHSGDTDPCNMAFDKKYGFKLYSGEKYRPLPYVKHQCSLLAEQLSKIAAWG